MASAQPFRTGFVPREAFRIEFLPLRTKLFRVNPTSGRWGGKGQGFAIRSFPRILSHSFVDDADGPLRTALMRELLTSSRRRSELDHNAHPTYPTDLFAEL